MLRGNFCAITVELTGLVQEGSYPHQIKNTIIRITDLSYDWNMVFWFSNHTPSDTQIDQIGKWEREKYGLKYNFNNSYRWITRATIIPGTWNLFQASEGGSKMEVLDTWKFYNCAGYPLGFCSYHLPSDVLSVSMKTQHKTNCNSGARWCVDEVSVRGAGLE